MYNPIFVEYKQYFTCAMILLLKTVQSERAKSTDTELKS